MAMTETIFIALQVIYMDVDNLPLRDPVCLLKSEPYQKTGAILWQDYWTSTIAPETAEMLGINATTVLPEGSFESGQMVMDKKR